MSDTREQIVEGLKRWAIGWYPTQAAVIFLAAGNQSLDRIWVKSTLVDGQDGGYWLDWEAFDAYAGGLSGGEYAFWALARSLMEGEFSEHLWRLDPDNQAAFALAIARCREDWR
jgi:hypothetical protein